jgi:hypothetical protein
LALGDIFSALRAGRRVLEDYACARLLGRKFMKAIFLVVALAALAAPSLAAPGADPTDCKGMIAQVTAQMATADAAKKAAAGKELDAAKAALKAGDEAKCETHAKTAMMAVL